MVTYLGGSILITIFALGGSIVSYNLHPKPIATINSGILVFLESDIIAYEANKKELLDADYKYWHTHIKWTFKK
jgi:hypothetical protein